MDYFFIFSFVKNNYKNVHRYKFQPVYNKLEAKIILKIWKIGLFLVFLYPLKQKITKKST